MRFLFVPFLAVLLFSSLALGADGVIDVHSRHPVNTTADRLESALLSKGMTVFARLNHAAAAAAVGLELPPTELVIFGNPKVGTPLMQCQQSVAIDLPQKALIWQGPDGQVRLSYNDPGYLAERHSLGACGEQALQKVAAALAGFARAATEP